MFEGLAFQVNTTEFLKLCKALPFWTEKYDTCNFENNQIERLFTLTYYTSQLKQIISKIPLRA